MDQMSNHGHKQQKQFTKMSSHVHQLEDCLKKKEDEHKKELAEMSNRVLELEDCLKEREGECSD